MSNTFREMRKGIAAALLFCACLFIPSVGFAQNTNSGDVRGTVTDSTGAFISNAQVTVMNVDTNVTKSYVTNASGVYDTSSIVPGRYLLTFTRDGFQQFVRGPITLQVGMTTVNAVLSVGSVNQQVVVTADVPLLKTESGEQSITMESTTLESLPNIGQTWENFTILMPGVTGAAGSSQGSSNPGQSGASNGNLPYSFVLADGASVTMPVSENGNAAVFETVGELQVSTSAFSAQYGVGGVIYNQITKGGTSNFHGAAYEYFRNDAMNAANFGFGNKITIPKLRYNNFGGSIGGPILKKKMFFYFNVDKTSSITAGSSGYITVPTAAVMSGDFTGFPTIYDPTTQVVSGSTVTRTSFAQEYGNGNKIPAGMIDLVAKAIQAYYPTSSNHPASGKFVAGTLSSGIYTNNYYYAQAAPSPTIKFFGRLDYDITPTNRLTISTSQRNNAYTTPGSVQCPIQCTDTDNENKTAQISDVWNVNSRTINEARLGFVGSLFFQSIESLNEDYPTKLGWQFAKANAFPSINTNNYYGLGAGSNATYKQFVYDPSDVLTLLRGKHILRIGGEYQAFQANKTTWGNINPGSLTYTGAYTQSSNGATSTGSDYADFLLGYSQSWNASVQPEFGARLKTPQMFVQDDIKFTPNFTLNVGLRYQLQHGWNEVKNNIRSFDPEVYNTATGTSGAMWYATTGANGRKALQANILNNLMPRAGFSWLLSPQTTFRGGIGLYSYMFSIDTFGGALGSALTPSGSVTDQTNGVNPVVLLSSSGSSLPYRSATSDPTAFNGQNVGYTQYHTPLGKSLQWNLGAQRLVGHDLLAEVSYVGTHGYDLPFAADINQVPESELAANDSPKSRPYPAFGSISGSTYNTISNYNALQAIISKRMTSGMSFSFNYTWSHFLDDMDSSGRGSYAGTTTYQNAHNPSANYGSSNFDVRHAFKGYMVYQLPFGKGQRFINNNEVFDAVLGGWQLSGTLVLLTGTPFTPVVGGSNNSYSQAGNWYPNVIGNPRSLSNRSWHKWYDPTAYSVPSAATFGNMRRNSLYGPGLSDINLTAGKTFSLPERVKLEIRAEATNALNHPSFGIPNRTLTPSSSCTTTSQFCSTATNISSVTVGGRAMQLVARFSF